MKALEILNKLKNKMLNFTSIDVENATIEIEAMQEHNREWFLKIIELTKQRDEAIAELEALQQPKSCEGCKWDNVPFTSNQFHCDECKHAYSCYNDNFEPKEQ